MTAPVGQTWDQTFNAGAEPIVEVKGTAQITPAEKKKGKREASAMPVTPAGEFAYIPLEQLFESPHNPRKHFDPAKLKELQDSIAASGIYTPLAVRPAPKGRYEIGAGHRRFRAAKAAGLTLLPCRIRTMDDAAFLELLAAENPQHDPLHPLEEAEGYRRLMLEGGADVAAIAARVGRSTRYVYDSLTLPKLIPEGKKAFLAGKFERGHAIELARLTPAQQKEILNLEPDEFRRERTGLWQVEHVERDPHEDDQEDLALEDAVKPVSVRELKRYINDHVRATSDAIDPFLFPQTTEQLAAAAAAKRKVVHITYDYRVPDAARDEKVRTYGEAAWKRADGEFKSKPCDHAVLGLVVAGPGRGEAFPVCIAKEKCRTHWADWQKERQRRQAELAKRAKGQPKGEAGTAAKHSEPAEPPQSLRVQWLQEECRDRLTTRFLPAIKAIIAELKISDEIAWNLAGADFFLDSWTAIGKKRYTGARGTSYGDELEELIVPELPGKWASKACRSFKDAAAARASLAFMIWAARDTRGLDAELEKAIAARTKTWRDEQARKAKSDVPQRGTKHPAKPKAKKKGAGK